MRCISLVSFVFVATACGGGGGGMTVDGPGSGSGSNVDVGFNKPAMPLQANMAGSAANTWVSLGSADLSCLGSANADVATTVDVTLNTTVRDFQSSNPVGGAAVVAFPDINTSSTFFTGSADGSGNIAVAIPTGTKRFGFKMTSAASMDTFLLNQYVDPNTAVQSDPAKIQIISKTTAQTLPALIGEDRTPGTGVVAGAVRDCNNHEISNFIATVSSTQGTATPIAGAEAYYFSASVGLPVHHDQQDASSQDALFMVIQLPTAQTAYVQAWGYLSAADLAADKLTLISELAVPVLPDTVITGSFEPKRAN